MFEYCTLKSAQCMKAVQPAVCEYSGIQSVQKLPWPHKSNVSLTDAVLQVQQVDATWINDIVRKRRLNGATVIRATKHVAQCASSQIQHMQLRHCKSTCVNAMQYYYRNATCSVMASTCLPIAWPSAENTHGCRKQQNAINWVEQHHSTPGSYFAFMHFLRCSNVHMDNCNWLLYTSKIQAYRYTKIWYQCNWHDLKYEKVKRKHYSWDRITCKDQLYLPDCCYTSKLQAYRYTKIWYLCNLHELKYEKVK